MKFKICHFSDTHTYHRKISLPECDLVIFSGDMSFVGSRNEVVDFVEWFADQRQCRHKVFIAGNHDRCFDPKYDHITKAKDWLEGLMTECITFDPDIYYLNNSHVEIDGVNVFGSPITPWFHGDRWAFNAHDDSPYWELIPSGTDIVVSHGPSWGTNDYLDSQRIHLGSKSLASKLENVQPKLFCCGHIHDGYGVTEKNGIIYSNASICDERYQPVNTPNIITLDVIN